MFIFGALGILFFSAIFFVMLNRLTKNLNFLPRNVLKLIIIIISGTAGVTIGGFILLLFLFAGGRFNEDSEWWLMEQPARSVVDQMRYDQNQTGKFPDEVTFTQKYRPALKSVEQTATIKYIYDNQTDSFVLFIKPIKGDFQDNVLIYTSNPKLEYGRFALTQDPENIWPNLGNIYPPAIPGPWDQLP